jgi:dTDP-4-amino-4,6-dideoxy-D-galactose acyltransferase
MTGNFKILDWDSNFFGFLVAQITLPKLEESGLHSILSHLKKRGVSLLYWASDPEDEASQKAARRCGGILVDKKTTYAIRLRHGLLAEPKVSVAHIEEYSEALLSPELERLAVQSGIFSRFNIDPNFSSRQFESLYKRWLLNSVTKVVADALFVAREDNAIVGMVSLKKNGDYGSIGLIAVDERMRGKKIATDLIQIAHRWFLAKECHITRVVTQGDNLGACKLYEKTGYRVEAVSNFYHFWLLK